ncbi:hypothetical protein CQA53_05670 [Helicobacter didelphidarum]|uniref:Uncharacterized protein n=1 Tax=Helicobacter didelphidarum TaxID=2040648 RepID=A0A3D8IMH5_9HELI|nr:hypothetical protein [Helicobacter didelphidarum]RDU65781.1 hypothetical protein CQA53_05670 [Helicobacter didelphidarum]
MPTIDLVIRILRLLEIKYGNFYDKRKYLDKSFSNLHSLSLDDEIRKAIESIDKDFFVGYDSTKMKDFIFILVRDELRKK